MWDSVAPKEGRLVLFPSWLLHGVMAVKMDAPSSLAAARRLGERVGKPRVSYAFNTGERDVVIEPPRKRKHVPGVTGKTRTKPRRSSAR